MQAALLVYSHLPHLQLSFAPSVCLSHLDLATSHAPPHLHHVSFYFDPANSTHTTARSVGLPSHRLDLNNRHMTSSLFLLCSEEMNSHFLR
jgi:hypothetical protein